MTCGHFAYKINSMYKQYLLIRNSIQRLNCEVIILASYIYTKKCFEIYYLKFWQKIMFKTLKITGVFHVNETSN